MAKSLPTFSVSSYTEDTRLKNSGTTKKNKTNSPQYLPVINVEDVVLTDVEQSSDELEDLEFNTKEITHIPNIIEMEGVYEETIGLGNVKENSNRNTKNKVTVYSLSSKDFGLNANDDQAGLTDVEAFNTSDEEIFNDDEGHFDDDVDILNQLTDERDFVEISDKIINNNAPSSPPVTPEPPRHVLRRRKPTKTSKVNNSKRIPLNKLSSKNIDTHLTADVSPTRNNLTDIELLVSNSESEVESTGVTKAVNKRIDGWVTDIEDLVQSSEDEKLIGQMRTSSSVQHFYYPSSDEGQNETVLDKKSKKKEKIQPKIILSKYEITGQSQNPFETHKDINKMRYKNASNSTNYKSANVNTSKKELSRGKLINSTQNMSKSSGKLNTGNTQVEYKYLDHRGYDDECYDGACTDTEVFQSDTEYSDFCKCKFKCPNHTSALVKSCKACTDHCNSLCLDCIENETELSPNPSPILMMSENSVITSNENIKEVSHLKVAADMVDSLTDTEELLLSTENKKSKSKNKLLKSLKVRTPDIGVTDTEDLELSDSEKVKYNFCNNLGINPIGIGGTTDTEDLELSDTERNKRYILKTLNVTPAECAITDIEDLSQSDNESYKPKIQLELYHEEAPLTDVDEFSAGEDSEDDYKMMETAITPEHFRFENSNIISVDKEGQSPYVSSEFEKHFLTEHNIPRIHTISPSPILHATDTEDMIASADEEFYFRNETPNPTEFKIELEDHCSVVHMKNTRAFQMEGDELLHVKGAYETHDPSTDIEEVFSQDENQVAVQFNEEKVDRSKVRTSSQNMGGRKKDENERKEKLSSADSSTKKLSNSKSEEEQSKRQQGKKGPQGAGSSKGK